jgi:hypothetical protein
MTEQVRFLGKHFGVVVPDDQLSSDELYVLAAARRRRIVMIRFPDGKLAPCDIAESDFDIEND